MCTLAEDHPEDHGAKCRYLSKTPIESGEGLPKVQSTKSEM
jgi:hypothetical protein